MSCFTFFNVNLTAEIFLLIHGVAYYSIGTILPQYLLYQSCYQKFNSSVCDQLESYPEQQQLAQKDATFWLAMTYLARYLPSCFTMITLGCLVDRIGEHKAMIIPPVIMGMRALLYVVCACYPGSSQLYIVGASALSMFYGDLPGVFVIVNSYIAVTTNVKNKSRRLIYMQGIIIVADFIPGILSGFIIKTYGYTMAFTSVLIVCALNLRFVLCCAKSTSYGTDEESLSLLHPIKKQASTYVNPYVDFVNALKMIYYHKYFRNFMIILIATVCNWATGRGNRLIYVLYITNKPFNFLSTDVGYYVAFYSILRGIGTIIVGHILTRYCKFSDYTIISIGLLAVSSTCLFIGLSSTGLQLYFASISGVAASISLPTFRSLVTKLVKKEDTGKALSVLECAGITCTLVTSLLVTVIYRSTLEINAGIVYFVLASFGVISLLIVFGMKYLLKAGILPDPADENEEEN